MLVDALASVRTTDARIGVWTVNIRRVSLTLTQIDLAPRDVGHGRPGTTIFVSSLAADGLVA